MRAPVASHRRISPSRLDRAGRVSVVSAAVATTAAALSAAPVGAQPREPRPAPATRSTPAELASRVDGMYAQTERATERFDAAAEREKTLRKRNELLRDRVAREQERVNRMRDGLATFAGAEYRSGGIDPALALILSDDPERFLDKAATLHRIGEREATRLRALQQALRALRQERVEAARGATELEQSRAVLTHRKKQVERRLAAARRLVASMSPGQRAEFLRASRSGERSLEDWQGFGDAGPSSARAAAAVDAARRAVGLPYVWGMAGPSGFDCSGLTYWAYRQAGVAIPRTSQAQRFAGRHVPLDQARPGDLVTYRNDASHVGMYMGHGRVLHAPHPGARVRYDPVNMIPGATVTRI